MTTFPTKSAPAAAKKPPLVTQPSPTIIARNVRRYVATCLAAVIEGQTCDFPDRKTPRLHGGRNGAEVESVRHLRVMHADLLAFEVKAKRSRIVQSESIELIAE